MANFKYVLVVRLAQITCRQSVHRFSAARHSRNRWLSPPSAPPLGRAERAKRLRPRTTQTIHFFPRAKFPAPSRPRRTASSRFLLSTPVRPRRGSSARETSYKPLATARTRAFGCKSPPPTASNRCVHLLFSTSARSLLPHDSALSKQSFRRPNRATSLPKAARRVQPFERQAPAPFLSRRFPSRVAAASPRYPSPHRSASWSRPFAFRHSRSPS